MFDLTGFAVMAISLIGLTIVVFAYKMCKAKKAVGRSCIED